MMSTERIQYLESRLRRMERAVVVCVSAAVLLIGLGMMQPDKEGAVAASKVNTPQDLKLRSLVIVDENGNDMILLKASGEEEGPSIQVNDDQGAKRFWMGTKEDGESRLEHWDFETSDRDSVLRILSSVNTEGHVLNQVMDERGTARIGTGTYSSDSDGQTGFISLIDKDENGRIWLGTSGNGMAEVIHTDSNGMRRIMDFTDGDSSKDPSEEEDASDFLGGRWYANPYGTCRLWTGSDRGRTGISLYDWSAIPRIGFGTGFSGKARMWLSDGEGEMVWSEVSEGEQAEQP